MSFGTPKGFWRSTIHIILIDIHAPLKQNSFFLHFIVSIMSGFDYTGLKSSLQNFINARGDAALTAAFGTVSSFDDASLDNASEAVIRTSKLVTSQGVSFSGGFKQGVSFLAEFVPLVSKGGAPITAEDGTDGELVGGIVLLLSPLTNQAFCRGTLTVRQGPGTKRYTTQRAVTFLRAALGELDATGAKTPLAHLEPADLTPVQLALAALFLRTATFEDLKKIDCIILRSVIEPISEEDISSFKATLKSDAVESTVRRNLESRQTIHRRLLVALMSMVGASPADIPAELSQIRASGIFN